MNKTEMQKESTNKPGRQPGKANIDQNEAHDKAKTFARRLTVDLLLTAGELAWSIWIVADPYGDHCMLFFLWLILMIVNGARMMARSFDAEQARKNAPQQMLWVSVGLFAMSLISGGLLAAGQVSAVGWTGICYGMVYTAAMIRWPKTIFGYDLGQ